MHIYKSGCHFAGWRGQNIWEVFKPLLCLRIKLQKLQLMGYLLYIRCFYYIFPFILTLPGDGGISSLVFQVKKTRFRHSKLDAKELARRWQSSDSNRGPCASKTNTHNCHTAESITLVRRSWAWTEGNLIPAPFDVEGFSKVNGRLKMELRLRMRTPWGGGSP